MKETDSYNDINSNWIKRWQEQNIGWHHVEYNPHLLNHWHSLHMPTGSLVLAPLCGKSRDMVWLAQQGYRIRGIELSSLAVEAFFKENKLQPTVRKHGEFDCWQTDSYEIYCGDIFHLQASDCKDVNVVYDRASLIALNPEQRRHYASMLIDLLPEKSRMLLVAMEYPQEQMQGPPYSVEEQEVRELFNRRYKVELLHSLDLLKDTQRYGDKGLSRMLERVYLLRE